MDMDFEKSFTFIAEDKRWKEKLAIGGGLSLLSVIFFLLPFFCIKHLSGVAFLSVLTVSFFVSVLLNLAIFGYFALTAHNRIHNKEQFLPEWSEFPALLVAGCKTVIGHILCFMPFIFIAGILLLFILLPTLIPDSTLAAVMALLFIAVGIFGYFILYALLLIFYYLLFGAFLKDMKILSFLNFKAAIDLVKNNIVNYLILWLLIIVISLIVQTVAILLCFTIIGIFALPWLIFYSYLVSADILAQFVKTAKE